MRPSTDNLLAHIEEDWCTCFLQATSDSSIHPSRLIFGCAIVRVACLEISWVLLTLEFIPAGLIFGVALVFANAPGVFGVSLALPCIPALLVVICAVRHLLFDLFVVVFHLQFEEFTP